MVNVGIALASTLIVNGISWVIKQIDDYVNRLDIAKEKLSETEDELGSVDSEIVDITARIKELESIGTLSLTDKEELERLREENKELAIRKKYLEDIKAQESEDVVQYTKEKMDYNYGRETSREDIDAYKKYMDNPEAYGGTYYEDDALTIKIAQYEKYQEQRKQAVENEDWEAIELIDKNLQQLEESLIADRTELQGFKDDLSLTGESSIELDNVNQKLKFIDDLLLAPSENLKNFLNSDAIANDVSKLKELANNGELTEEKFKQSFSAINSYLEENNLSFEDLISTLEIYRDELNNTTQASTKFTKTEMIDTINSMADGFDVLDDIYADVLDGGTFDFTKLDTSKFSEAFSEITPEYEKFIETVSASPTDIDACQGAFNDLVSAFIDSKGVLEGVDEETKQLTIDMLENMGVVNAEEVVMSTINAKLNEYADAKSVCASAGIDLTNATRLEILELMREQEMSEETRISLWRYQMQKALSNENGINTVYDCVQLENLARASGYTGSALLYLAKIKSLLNKIDNENIAEGTLPYRMIEMQIKQCNSSLQQLLSTEVATTKVTVNYGGASKTAAVAQDKLKDSTKKATDALEKQKEKLEETKSKYETLFDAVDYFYQKQEDKIDKQIDGLQDVNEQLEKQLNNLDGIMSAMDLVYESEIKNLKAQQDAIDDAIDGKEKELAVENALKKVREANSRNVLGIYEKGKGIVYKKDEKAISEAMDEYEQANAEKAKADIQDKIDLIESYRDRLNEIPKAWENAYNAQLAYERLGSGWQEAILNPSDDLFNNLESDYSGIQGNIASNDSKIDKLEAEKERIQELRKLWEEAKNEYKYAEYEKMLSTFIGSDYDYQLLNNSAVWRRKFANEYSSICSEIEALEERIKASSETTASTIESSAERVKKSAEGMSNSITYIFGDEEKAILKSAQDEFDQLCYWIDQGKTGFIGARDALAVFLQEYPKLNGATEASEELKTSVSNLQNIYENTGRSFGTMIDNADGRITDFETKSRTLSENLTEVDAQMQSITSSEAQVEETVNSELSNTEQTISNLLTKLGELKTNLSEIIASRTEVETIADEELLDTSTVVDGVHTKVGEIQSAMSILLESITPLEGALDTLMEKLTTLDEVTLSGVIGAFGGASGGEGGDSKESGGKNKSKSSEGGKGESSDASGLLGAVKAVDEAIGSTENPESLLGKLQNLDDKTLEKIIAQFGLGGENGESEGENLLSAVNAVSQAIVGGKDDDTSLIANIEKLGSDPTIENITTVSDSFQTLHDTIDECVKKVEELSKAIESIPSSTATVGVNGGKSSGKAKGGIITKEDEGDLDFVAKSLGEDHMVALTEGEAVIPKENVAKNPEVVQSLIDGEPLKPIIPEPILANKKQLELEAYWSAMESSGMFLESPKQYAPKLRNDIAGNIINNNQQKSTTVYFGDIHVHGVQNADAFAREIETKMSRKVTQALSKNSL